MTSSCNPKLVNAYEKEFNNDLERALHLSMKPQIPEPNRDGRFPEYVVTNCGTGGINDCAILCLVFLLHTLLPKNFGHISKQDLLEFFRLGKPPGEPATDVWFQKVADKLGRVVCVHQAERTHNGWKVSDKWSDTFQPTSSGAPDEVVFNFVYIFGHFEAYLPRSF